MPARTDDHTIRNLIDSAKARLQRAETYDARTRPELTCEDAQQTAELALKAVIKARGGVYKRTHEIEHLLETLENLGETIPAAVEPAKQLTDYGGAERYEFIAGDSEIPGIETVTDAVKAARETLTWCTARIRTLKPHLSLEPPLAESGAPRRRGADGRGRRTSPFRRTDDRFRLPSTPGVAAPPHPPPRFAGRVPRPFCRRPEARTSAAPNSSAQSQPTRRASPTSSRRTRIQRTDA